MTNGIRHRGTTLAFALALLFALALSFGAARSEAQTYWTDEANDRISRAEDDVPEDTTPPDTVFDGTPNEFTNESTVYFDFHSTESGSYFECDFGDDDWAFCSSPVTIYQVTQGHYVFRVRSTDSAGNVDPTPATFEFEVDQFAPVTTIDSGPEGTIDTSEVTFAFSADESPVQFTCTMDGIVASDCSSPTTYTDLPEGEHEFEVYSTDKFGNISDPVTRDFTIESESTVPTKPGNSFTFGKLKLNKKKGTATIQVKVPGKGTVFLIGSKTVKPALKQSRGKSTVTLAVAAKGKAAKTLKKVGKVKLAVRVRFTPTGGDARVKTKSLTLLKPRK